MSHELDTRLSRRVSHVSYVPNDDDDELLALEEELEAVTAEDWQPNCCVRFVERFPYLILILMLLSAGGCATLLYFYAPVPNFITGDDPTEGFEPRGTEIHKRSVTLDSIYEHYHLIPNISLITQDLDIPEDVFGFGQAVQRSRRDVVRRSDVSGFGSCTEFHLTDSDTMKLVIKPKHGNDLLTFANIKAWCHLEADFLHPLIESINGLTSIPQLILCVNDKVYGDVGCEGIMQTDITHFKQFLSTCATYYYNKTIGGHAPIVCIKHLEIIQQFFTYMAPIGFYNSSEPESISLPYALTYINWYAMKETDPEEVYRDSFEMEAMENDNVKIVAMTMPSQDDVKYDLFSDYLLSDLKKYFSLALGLILSIMLLYTKSLALMLGTVLNVTMSFVFACAIYFFICRLTFFPFINLLAGLVLIAIGADDIFIFYDTWKQTRTENSHLTLAQTLSKSYTHATLSIFVTSFTTASAFFTNTVSSTITTIRCFGIFAGISIIVNFCVMMVWTPACVVCVEKLWQRFIGGLRRKSANSAFQKSVRRIEDFFDNNTSKSADAVYGHVLPMLVERFWYLWIVILLTLGVGGAVVIFYNPKLQLPKSQDFQLFLDDNLLENWDLNFVQSFPYQIEVEQHDSLSLWVVFGIEPKDNGNWLDPDDVQSAVTEDKMFDFYDNQTQIWLNDFCNDVKNQPFIASHYKHQPCALSKYGELFQVFCTIKKYAVLLKSCCSSYKLPYTHHQLKTCLPALQIILGNNLDMLGDPIYDPDNNVTAFVMFTDTNLNFSLSYDEMAENYRVLKQYFSNRFDTAPTGLKTGFFTAGDMLTFFDLQGAIARGTNLSIMLSIAVAFGIMLITTLNLIITLYAILSITFSILCTVASIVLLGWDLNIIESITISLAIGLSIDFTIHYGVAYRLSTAREPRQRVRESFSRVGSAVAMAALTTFSAGAAMMPARVIVYTKLGTFLMLVMMFSWVYATFLFQSICRIIGPKGNCCQLSCTKCKTPPNHRTLVINPNVDDDDDSLITFS